MKLRDKQTIDYFAGGLFIAVLKPWVWLLGCLLQRDHTPEVRKSLCIIKMQGGGSLLIAYPALLGLRQQYPSATFSLIATKGVASFGRSLGVFDRIDELDDSSFFRLVKSGLFALLRNLRVDTVVDLEVYSRLTAVLSTLTGARNRIGFYLEGFFWRKGLITHLVFFNRSSGSFYWYDAIARLLGAEPVSPEACRRLMKKTMGLSNEPRGRTRRIAIGHACSDLAGERMLNERQWVSVFRQHLPSHGQFEVFLLGTEANRDLADRIIRALRHEYRELHFQNLCGVLSLKESVRALHACDEFWGVDSGLLHYARLLGIRTVSYWGPTDPATLLRPVAGQEETIHYARIPCSPCVHVAEQPPCYGNNVCIQCLFDPEERFDSIGWCAYGVPRDHRRIILPSRPKVNCSIPRTGTQGRHHHDGSKGPPSGADAG